MNLTDNYLEYAINAYTMMIQPMHYEDKLYSRIFQLDGEVLHSPHKPTAIIKKTCLANACSYDGRVNGSRYVLGSYQKVPITINSENQMFYFPTTSPDHVDCIWVNPIHVDEFYPIDKKTILVKFHNNQTVEIPVSYHIFNNQMNKTIALKNKVNQKNQKNRGELHFLYRDNVRLSERVSDRGKSSDYTNSLDNRGLTKRKKKEE